jgi:homoserine dehydrogenase
VLILKIDIVCTNKYKNMTTENVLNVLKNTTKKSPKALKIGLFGFGCVGQGIFELLEQSKEINAKIVKIGVKNPNKKRTVSDNLISYNATEILYNPEINLVIELIDDAEVAYEIVTTAMKEGKAVISANKKLIANHLTELLELQKEYDVPFLYEASVCGSIPIIRNLEEYYNTDFLSSVETICNGTTNYILTKTATEKLTYNEALKQAQDLGFAESDPTLDVQGFDAKFKLIILALHAFGIILKPEEVLNYGIHNLNIADTVFANEHGFKMKLLAKAYRIGEGFVAYVAPHFVEKSHAFYNVDNEFNAVQVAAQFAEKQTFIGKGAGSHPTASAVLSDLAAVRYDYQYEYKNIGQELTYNPKSTHKVYFRYTSSSDLIGLNFSNITKHHQGHELSFIIGEVSLENLIEVNLNERENVFLAFF